MERKNGIFIGLILCTVLATLAAAQLGDYLSKTEVLTKNANSQIASAGCNCATGCPYYGQESGLPGFGIYHGNELIISDKDIESYNWTSHEFRLTPDGVAKIKSHGACDNVLEPPYDERIENIDWCQPGSGLYGEEFVAKLGDAELYKGVFSSIVSSTAYYNEVVLGDVLRVSNENPIMGFSYESLDPRDNTILMDYLRENGKLIK